MKPAKILLSALFAVVFVSSVFSAVPSSTTWVQYVLTTNPQTLTVPFVFQNGSDLLVLDSKASPPVTLAQNSDYSVAGGSGSTGTVVTSPNGSNAVKVGDVITISRRVPLTQTTNFANGGPLTASMIGQAFDKLTEISQQLNLVGANSLQFPGDEQRSGLLSKTARAGNLLGFAANGAIQFYPLSAIIFPTIAPIQATSISALKSVVVSTVANGYQIAVSGYYAANDGGGGLFVYNSTSSATDDGGSVIAPNGGSGRWLRVLQGPYDVRFWGAKGDGLTDDTLPIQATITYALSVSGGKIKFSGGPGTNYAVGTITTNPYCFNIGSNLTFTSEPGVTLTCTLTAANIALFGNVAAGLYSSLSVYPTGAMTKGSATVTTTTAANAGNFAYGDYIYLRGGTSDGSTPNAELNIVEAANASTGVITLRYPFVKTLATSGTYGVAKANAYTVTGIAFENLKIVSPITIFALTQVFGLRLQNIDANVTNTTSGDFPIFSCNSIRKMAVLNCRLTNQTQLGGEGIWQVASNTMDVKVDNCDFATPNGTFSLQFTEGSANLIFTNNRFFGTGAIVGTFASEIKFDANYINIAVPALAAKPVFFMGGSGASTDNVSFTNNRIVSGGTLTAIQFGGANNVVAGNTILTNCTNGGSTAAVFVSGVFDGGIIANNTIYCTNATAPTGIDVSCSVHRFTISGNNLFGAASGTAAIAVEDNGVQTIGFVCNGNVASGFTYGVFLGSVAHEVGYVVAANSMGANTNPYQPASVGGWIASGNTIQSPQGAQLTDNGSGGVSLTANNASQGVTLTAQSGGTILQKVTSTTISTAAATGVTATGLGETSANFAGTVTLTAGAGTITSAAISTTSTIILTLVTPSGANVYPQVKANSGTATVTGAGTDAGVYNWRLLQ